jgi:hypothetical protein
VRAQVQLKLGEVSAGINPKRTSFTSFEVQSPIATAGIRGTAFSVRHVDKPRPTTVFKVIEGRVLVTPNNKKLKPIMLPAGSEARVTNDKITTKGETLPPDTPFEQDTITKKGATLPPDDPFKVIPQEGSVTREKQGAPPAPSYWSETDTITEQKPNQKIMSLGEGERDKVKEPKKEVATKTHGPGSPGMYFRQYIQQISAQECMRRAKAAFESEGMTIGAGDYWWYGASEPRFHSYNNCLDIGNGYIIVNFTSASWRMDTLDHLNRLTSAHNSPPGTLSKKTPYSGDVPRPIPELYMWLQIKNLSQPECIRRATAALKSEGLNITGSDVWWVGGNDSRFNTYVACTNLGNGKVYVNVTSTSSQTEDIARHRNRITKEFD